jgi:hypothetical protein
MSMDANPETRVCEEARTGADRARWLAASEPIAVDDLPGWEDRDGEAQTYDLAAA